MASLVGVEVGTHVGGRGRLRIGEIGIGEAWTLMSGNGTTSRQIGLAHAVTRPLIPVTSTNADRIEHSISDLPCLGCGHFIELHHCPHVLDVGGVSRVKLLVECGIDLGFSAKLLATI